MGTLLEASFDKIDDVHNLQVVNKPNKDNQVMYKKMTEAFKMACVHQSQIGDILSKIG